MKTNISNYFAFVTCKRLSEVDVNPTKSNQHEFAAGQLKKHFGDIGKETIYLETHLVYLSDEEEPTVDSCKVSYYDSRRNVEHRGPEWRCYYEANRVIELASAGDLLITAVTHDDRMLLAIAEEGSTYESQLLYLFGVTIEERDALGEAARELELSSAPDLTTISATLLELFGEELPVDENYLDDLIKTFGNSFPTTRVFSDYARKTISEVSAFDNIDTAVFSWYEREEELFRVLEKHIVAERLEAGFRDDVDGFISFSLSVQNRRKSRAGHALENHIEAALKQLKIPHTRGARTEGAQKPDFLFPSAACYHNPEFPGSGLTMLGVKTSCKDRWGQVLKEAKRIPRKHLFTLEPAISESTTGEMEAKNLQLVVAEPIQSSYTPAQREWLMDLTGFVKIVTSSNLS